MSTLSKQDGEMTTPHQRTITDDSLITVIRVYTITITPQIVPTVRNQSTQKQRNGAVKYSY